MSDLIIKPTRNTPFVNFNDNTGILVFEGKSYPNDSISFFQPLFDWVENYRAERTLVKIKLEYFNTSTCKQLLSLLRVVIDNNCENELTVNWYYEENDLDVMEIGQHMENILKVKFAFKPFVEEKITKS